MREFLLSLNPEQQKAVTTTEGPVLILAGAGSGKTKTLTHRIAYLIEEKKVSPESILAVTFTNKAAEEMLFRASKLVNTIISAERPSPFLLRTVPAFGTFHSICAKILRSECEKIGYKTNFAIYDPDDQLKLVKGILKDLNLDEKRNNPKTILGIISRAKNELKDEVDFLKHVDSPISEVASKVYPAYQKILKANNAFDFDDLLMKTVQLFQTDQKTLDYYSSLWKYVHVDEYQDTNFVQYTLIKMIADKHKNICVVGDPDQSIYGWRGADIRNILDFEKDYGNITTIKLEQNYRSTKTILKAAQNIIVKNLNRKEKTLWTENPKGNKIKVVQAENEKHESDSIIMNLERLLRDNKDKTLNDAVVLYRINAQSRSLEEACLRYAIPYKIIGGVKFYERKEIKDIIAYLRLILNPDDNLSLERIINVPPRNIGETTFKKLKIAAERENESIYYLITKTDFINTFPTRTKESLKQFVVFLNDLKEKKEHMEVSDLIEYIFEKSGLKNYLDDDSSDGEARIENIEELLSVSQKYDYLESELGLLHFMQEISLLTDADRKLENDNKLTLMTMHLAKGLEFDFVFIAGAEENLFPHSRSQLDFEQLEEERRLAYVSMTRAKQELYIFLTKKRMLFGFYQYNEPSRFLYDLPKEIVEGFTFNKFLEDFSLNTDNSDYEYSDSENNVFNQPKPQKTPNFEPAFDYSKNENLKEQDKVLHPQYGQGTILERRGDIVKIVFKNGEKKSFALSIARLERI